MAVTPVNQRLPCPSPGLLSVTYRYGKTKRDHAFGAWQRGQANKAARAAANRARAAGLSR